MEENEYKELNFAELALCLQGLNSLQQEIEEESEEDE